MSSISVIRSESLLLSQASMWAHHLKDSIQTHRNHKGHLVLALDPKKLELVAKKFRADNLPNMDNINPSAFGDQNLISKIKLRYPTLDERGLSNHTISKRLNFYKIVGKGIDIGIITGTIAIALVSAGIVTLSLAAIIGIILAGVAIGMTANAVHQHRDNKKQLVQAEQEAQEPLQPQIEFVLKPRAIEAARQLYWQNSPLATKSFERSARAL